MTTSEPKETPVKPEIPALNLSEAQEVPRKKTFTEKVKGIKETVKRAVTPRSRSASMNEEDLTAAAAKKAKTEVEEVGAEAKSEADKPTYAQMAKKATKAVKKTLGMEPTKKEEEEAQADAASTLSKEKKEKKEKNGTVAGGVAGGLVAVGLLILGVVLSKAGAKPAEPVVEKKKKSFGFGKQVSASKKFLQRALNMPKSKRNKVVSLTQVKKKDREWKEGLVSQIQRQLDTYPTVYLLRYENFRNEAFKSLREKVRDSSTFCLGSNKVLKVALGKSEAEEYRSNLHLLANDMSGNSALLFTRLPQADVERMVDSFEVLDYARAGAPATEEFAIPAGPVLQYGDPIAHTMEPTLRKHGMPTKLNKGVVELLTDFTVCREGDTLTPDQAALLKIFGVQMATFKMELVGRWEEDGGYERLLAEVAR